MDGSGQVLILVLLTRQNLDELGPFRQELLEPFAIDGVWHGRSKPYHGP